MGYNFLEDISYQFPPHWLRILAHNVIYLISIYLTRCLIFGAKSCIEALIYQKEHIFNLTFSLLGVFAFVQISHRGGLIIQFRHFMHRLENLLIIKLTNLLHKLIFLTIGQSCLF